MHKDEIPTSEDTTKLQKTDPALAQVKKLPQPEVEADKTSAATLVKSQLAEVATPIGASVPRFRATSVKSSKRAIEQVPTTVTAPKRLAEEAQLRRIQCKQLGISVFFQDAAPVRSLGFTSAIHGEGKSFLANLTAQVLAEDSNIPVTLLECNWENPWLVDAFDLVPGPGLAEWLMGDCKLGAIRQQVSSNLTVIPAGDGKNNCVPLLQEFRHRGVLDVLTQPEEVLIVDLPPLVTTDYGQVAAKLAEALVLVVRMGVTPDAFVTEACRYLKDMHVHGVIFNQITSRVPQWLRQAL